MSTAQVIAVIVLFALLMSWRHIAAFVLEFHEDYNIWVELKSRGLESRSFLAYFWEECL